MPHPTSLLSIVLSAALVGCVRPPDPESSHLPVPNHDVAQAKDAQWETCSHTQLDNWLADVTSDHVGCAAAIADASGMVYAAADGFAEHSFCDNADAVVPYSIHTLSPVGSISKTLTTVAFFRLWEGGYISDGLTDDLEELTIGDFLDLSDSPTIAPWVSDVTLHDLLSHQAFRLNDVGWRLVTHYQGAQAKTADLKSETLPDLVDLEDHLEHVLQGTELAQLQDADDDRWDVHPANAIHTLKSPSQQAQATKRGYSNIGYTFVAAIMDRILRDIDCEGHLTCGPYGSAFRNAGWELGYESYVWWVWNGEGQYLDGPTSMALMQPHREGNLPNLAKDYFAGQGSCDPAPDWYPGWIGGPGGWAMTVGDLARVGMIVRDEDILNHSTWSMLKTWYSPERGGYGYGLQVNPWDGAALRRIGHGGLVRGYVAGVLMWESSSSNVGAWVCNSHIEDNPPNLLGRTNEAIALANTLATCEPSLTPSQAAGRHMQTMQSVFLEYVSAYGARAESMFRSVAGGHPVTHTMVERYDRGDLEGALACALIYLGGNSGSWQCASTGSDASR